MSYRWPNKTPVGELTYGFRFALQPGATLTAASWASTPAGLTIITSNHDANAKLALVKLGGGTLNVEYDVTCTFTDSNGEIDQRTAKLKIVEKKPT
jgi:hypothetical protein